MLFFAKRDEMKREKANGSKRNGELITHNWTVALAIFNDSNNISNHLRCIWPSVEMMKWKKGCHLRVGIWTIHINSRCYDEKFNTTQTHYRTQT